MGRKPTILKEAVHQAFEEQPLSYDMSRNEPDIVLALKKNYRDIRLASMGAKLVVSVRRHLIDVIAAKAFLVFLNPKNRERAAGGMEELLVKLFLTFPALRELIR